MTGICRTRSQLSSWPSSKSPVNFEEEFRLFAFDLFHSNTWYHISLDKLWNSVSDLHLLEWSGYQKIYPFEWLALKKWERLAWSLLMTANIAEEFYLLQRFLRYRSFQFWIFQGEIVTLQEWSPQIWSCIDMPQGENLELWRPWQCWSRISSGILPWNDSEIKISKLCFCNQHDLSNSWVCMSVHRMVYMGNEITLLEIVRQHGCQKQFA